MEVVIEDLEHFSPEVQLAAATKGNSQIALTAICCFRSHEHGQSGFLYKVNYRSGHNLFEIVHEGIDLGAAVAVYNSLMRKWG